MDCSHTKGNTYREMYWYRQLPEEGMKQIVFTTAYSDHQYESGFKPDKFPAAKKDAQTGSLTVERLLFNDSGVYFCAVSQHSDTGDWDSCTNTNCCCHSGLKDISVFNHLWGSSSGSIWFEDWLFIPFELNTDAHFSFVLPVKFYTPHLECFM